MNSVNDAGTILYALKMLLRQHQEATGATSLTASEWLGLDQAIAATGFNVNRPFERAAVGEWQSGLTAALRTTTSGRTPRQRDAEPHRRRRP